MSVAEVESVSCQWKADLVSMRKVISQKVREQYEFLSPAFLQVVRPNFHRDSPCSSDSRKIVSVLP